MSYPIPTSFSGLIAPRMQQVSFFKLPALAANATVDLAGVIPANSLILSIDVNAIGIAIPALGAISLITPFATGTTPPALNITEIAGSSAATSGVVTYSAAFGLPVTSDSTVRVVNGATLIAAANTVIIRITYLS